MGACDALLLIGESPGVSPITQAPVVSASGVTSFCNGGQVMLSAAVINDCHSYQWKRNSEIIQGATGGNLMVTVSGVYQLEESYNGAMAHLSNSISVTVSPEHPEITSDGVVLHCTVCDVAYQWMFGTSVSALANIPGATSQQHTPQLSGVYAVAITDNLNCKDTAGVFSFWMVGIPVFSNSIPNKPVGDKRSIHQYFSNCFTITPSSK